jgi:hypothetical protein
MRTVYILGVATAVPVPLAQLVKGFETWALASGEELDPSSRR